MADDDETPAAPTFADALRAALKTSRTSQKELSRRLAGVPKSTAESEAKRSLIGKWLKGKHEPEPENAEAVEEALGITDGHLVAAIQRKQRGRAASLTRAEELAGLREEIEAVRADVRELGREVRDLREAIESRRGDHPPGHAGSGGPGE